MNIITDRETGRTRGFAFIEMPDSSEAEKAIVALNFSGLGGRLLNVSEAKPKVDRPRGMADSASVALAGTMIIAVMRASRARASVVICAKISQDSNERYIYHACVNQEHLLPRSRSRFNKRQKQHARQQKPCDKAERRNKRKLGKVQTSMGVVDDLRERAEAQAALFQVSSDEPISSSNSCDETGTDNIGTSAKVSSPSGERERPQS